MAESQAVSNWAAGQKQVWAGLGSAKQRQARDREAGPDRFGGEAGRDLQTKEMIQIHVKAGTRGTEPRNVLTTLPEVFSCFL